MRKRKRKKNIHFLVTSSSLPSLSLSFFLSFLGDIDRSLGSDGRKILGDSLTQKREEARQEGGGGSD